MSPNWQVTSAIPWVPVQIPVRHPLRRRKTTGAAAVGPLAAAAGALSAGTCPGLGIGECGLEFIDFRIETPALRTPSFRRLFHFVQLPLKAVFIHCRIIIHGLEEEFLSKYKIRQQEKSSAR